jgi:hypothetical protein
MNIPISRSLSYKHPGGKNCEISLNFGSKDGLSHELLSSLSAEEQKKIREILSNAFEDIVEMCEEQMKKEEWQDLIRKTGNSK